MKTGIYFKLDQEQIDHIKAQPNQSQYIGALVKAEQHRETRYDYIWPVIEKYVKDRYFKGNEIPLIGDLAMKLARSLSGSDIINEIMEGETK